MKLSNLLHEGAVVPVSVEACPVDGFKKDAILSRMKKGVHQFGDLISSKIQDDCVSLTALVPDKDKAAFVKGMKDLLSGMATVKSV